MPLPIDQRIYQEIKDLMSEIELQPNLMAIAA